MAVRGSAVHKNHNPILYIELSPLNHLFLIMVDCPGHMLESTKGLKLNLIDYKFCLLWTIGIWGAFLAFSELLVYLRLGSLLCANIHFSIQLQAVIHIHFTHY